MWAEGERLPSNHNFPYDNLKLSSCLIRMSHLHRSDGSSFTPREVSAERSSLIAGTWHYELPSRELLCLVLVGLGLLEMQEMPARLFHASLAQVQTGQVNQQGLPWCSVMSAAGFRGTPSLKHCCFHFLGVISFSLKMACEIALTFLSVWEEEPMSQCEC